MENILNLLRSVKNKFDWVVSYYGIRGYSKDGQLIKYCPLTAVCRILENKNYSVAKWAEAAEEIGLLEHEGQIIVDVADEWFPQGCLSLEKLRNEMLEILDLKEKVLKKVD